MQSLLSLNPSVSSSRNQFSNLNLGLKYKTDKSAVTLPASTHLFISASVLRNTCWIGFPDTHFKNCWWRVLFTFGAHNSLKIRFVYVCIINCLKFTWIVCMCEVYVYIWSQLLGRLNGQKLTWAEKFLQDSLYPPFMPEFHWFYFSVKHLPLLKLFVCLFV